MALEWVLLTLMTLVSTWLGLGACRESTRLQHRLREFGPHGRALVEDLRVGIRP
jgi:hypothetical protein